MFPKLFQIVFMRYYRRLSSYRCSFFFFFISSIYGARACSASASWSRSPLCITGSVRRLFTIVAVNTFPVRAAFIAIELSYETVGMIFQTGNLQNLSYQSTCADAIPVGSVHSQYLLWAAVWGQSVRYALLYWSSGQVIQRLFVNTVSLDKRRMTSVLNDLISYVCGSSWIQKP